jgi:hypothetical protein
MSRGDSGSMAPGVGRGMLWLVLNTSDIGHDASSRTKELSSAVYFVKTLDTRKKLTS